MSLAMEITPGPNMSYLAILSLTKGRRAGFAAVGGVAIGLALIGVLGAIGAAVVVSTSPTLYQLLRWGGILYLLWLAWDGWVNADTDISATPENHHHDGRYFVRGLMTNVLNPKAFIFYVSVLPNFISPAHHPVTGALLLTALYVAIATGVHVSIVSLAAWLRRLLDQPEKVRFVSRALAVLLVGVAVWLFFET